MTNPLSGSRPSRQHAFFVYFLGILALFAALQLAGTDGNAQRKVKVGNGVSVPKKTFNAPINEQPFFGFAKKTVGQKYTDVKIFIQDWIQQAFKTKVV